jgi:threonine/homoserine/homoserine lactone efflux protein
MLAYIVQGLGYGLTAAAQPGPFQTFVFGQTLRRGWRRALPIALAPLISDGPIIALVTLVLNQIPRWLERFLYLAGGLFLFYLAWDAYRSWRTFDPTASFDTQAKGGLLKAALANLLVPGPYLFWSLVTGPILIAGWREMPVHGISFLAGFYVAMVGSLAAMIVLLGTARQLGSRVNRALQGVSAIALAGFGLYQLWRGLFGIRDPLFVLSRRP